MKTTEVCNPHQPHLDTLSQIKVDSSKWIETVFITDRFLPNKQDIKNCYFNNRLLSKEEALEICKIKWLVIPKDIDNSNFFIHHKKLWVISFQKWDFIIDESWWYRTTDWKNILPYDPKWTYTSRHYFNNKLLSKKEAIEFAHKHNIKIAENINKHYFFIYHEHLGIVPFQKWDFVITDEWYATTDWKYIICYDNNWEELWFF